MNRNEWRTAVQQQAGRLRQRLIDLAQQPEQLAPGVIYGATASLAVTPLVAAAQDGAVPYDELLKLLGGAGINLLSTELYDWRKRSEKEIDEALSAHLGQLATQAANWREILDTLIQATQAGNAVQAELGQAATAYLAALQQDAQRLGSRLIVANVSKAENTLTGDGSTMTVTKNNNDIDLRGSQGAIFGATGPVTQNFGPQTNNYGPVPPITFADVLHTYLARERRHCDELPLAKPKADARRIPRLQNVFVELRTTLPVDETTWFDRLGVAPDERQKLRQKLAQQTGDGAAAKQRKAAAALATDENRAWFAELHRLDEKKLAAAARTLNVTPDQVRAARYPLTPLETLRSLRSQNKPLHLVLLGDPGGGKSTWVRRLTSVLAWDRLAVAGATLEPLTDEEAAWLQAAQAAFGQPVSGLAPVRIAMHRWASLVRKGELKLTGTAGDLVALCAHTLKEAHAAESISVYDNTLHILQHGAAVILLDGLDEVNDDANRLQMIAAVRAFVQETTYQNTPLLITCRSKPYARLQARGHAVLGDDHLCTLGPLDDDAIQCFIERWYAEMTWAERGEPAKLQADARRLHEALPVRPDLQRMAGTPLLLTMMARTNQESGLPDGRAELYENLVQELLWEWEVRRTYGEAGADNVLPADGPGADKPTDGRSLLEILHAANPGLSQPDVEKVLNQLAYAIHAGTTGGEVEIERRTLEEHFARLAPCLPDDAKGKARAAELATNMVNFIGQRTGLLVDIEDGQRFRFTHYTFQEYLAARWIAFGNYADCLSKLDQRIANVHWREAIFLAFGYLISEVRKAYDDAILLVEDLVDRPLDSTTDWQRLLLLGETYVRQFTPDKLRRTYNEARCAKVTRLVADRLRQAMQERTLTPATRLEAGLLLDDLRSQHGMAPEGLDEFIAVPNTHLYVGKYPVTNLQFRRFTNAGGYGEARGQRPPWWSEQGWNYRCEGDWTAPRYWDNRRVNRDTQPVVGVSWYEAEAYCNWLNDPNSAARLPTGTRAQLPTQDEWMLAARNGRAAPEKDRDDYPWRSAFAKALANTTESNFGQTTPVDMYRDGATPAGAFDLAGNVLEWTADEYDKDRDRFWMKGGCWRFDAKDASASAAGYGDFGPYWNVRGGFRVFCVPSLS